MRWVNFRDTVYLSEKAETHVTIMTHVLEYAYAVLELIQYLEAGTVFWRTFLTKCQQR